MTITGPCRLTRSEHCWRCRKSAWRCSYIYCYDASEWSCSSDSETQSKLIVQKVVMIAWVMHSNYAIS